MEKPPLPQNMSPTGSSSPTANPPKLHILLQLPGPALLLLRCIFCQQSPWLSLFIQINTQSADTCQSPLHSLNSRTACLDLGRCPTSLVPTLSIKPFLVPRVLRPHAAAPGRAGTLGTSLLNSLEFITLRFGSHRGLQLQLGDCTPDHSDFLNSRNIFR